MKRILLTGSEGRLATSTLKPMLEEMGDVEIIGFDTVIGDDLLYIKSLESKLLNNNIDTVIHAAAVPGPTKTNDYKMFEKVNTNGSINVMDVAARAKIKKFIFFSSFSYYGCDAWMRDRQETGPVTGDDVAIPKYLPIDEEHPSILVNDCDKLSDYNGKYYGMSKAKVEKYAAETIGQLGFSFVSMRLAGFSTKHERYIKDLERMKRDSKKGIADLRKQRLFGVAGMTTDTILKSSLKAILLADFEGCNAFNICEAGSGLSDVVKAYFPTLTPTDQIFSNLKIRILMNKMGVPFYPEEKVVTPLISRAEKPIRKAIPFKKLIHKVIR